MISGVQWFKRWALSMLEDIKLLLCGYKHAQRSHNLEGLRKGRQAF